MIADEDKNCSRNKSHQMKLLIFEIVFFSSSFLFRVKTPFLIFQFTARALGRIDWNWTADTMKLFIRRKNDVNKTSSDEKTLCVGKRCKGNCQFSREQISAFFCCDRRTNMHSQRKLLSIYWLPSETCWIVKHTFCSKTQNKRWWNESKTVCCNTETSEVANACN